MKITIVGYLTALLSQVSLIYVFGKISHYKMKINIKIIGIILIETMVQVILNMYSNLLSSILAIVYLFFMFKKIYGCKKIEAQNYSIILWTISILLDVLIMLTVNVFNLMEMYELNRQLYKSLGTVMMSIILIVLANVNPIIKMLNKFYEKMCKLNISMDHITLIIIVFLYIGFMSSKNMSDTATITMLLIGGISSLIIIILFILMRYQVINLKRTNEILEKNNEVNVKVINQYRILKHNLESQLLGVKTVSNKKAKELIDELILEYNSSFYIKHDINEIPTGINGLIYEKLYNYKEENINITVTNKIKSKILEAVGARNYNVFCEALGVTLDNALESSKKSKEKIIYLEFKENKEYITLKIMNTFTGKIELDKLGTVYYTSKEKGHGLGLYSLIGRKNLSITTSIKNNMFINTLEVKKRKK